MNHKDDIKLIQQVQEGHHQAFQTIVERYRQQVARTVIGMLGQTDEADDVGQEVFIRLFKAMDNYRGDASLGTYLTRIAINLSLNAIKKNKSSKISKFFQKNDEKEKEDKYENLANYDNEHEANDNKELVQLALARLDPKFRSVIILRMLEGYSTKETADMLNLPLGTVLSRLTRAQDKLKVELINLGYEKE